MTQTGLPDGFHVRPATLDDVEAVVAVIHAEEVMEAGEVTVDAVSFRADWTTPGMDLERDTWVVTAPDGRIVAYQDVATHGDDGHVDAEGAVLPEFQGRGIGTALLARAAARARELTAHLPPGTERALHAGVNVRNTAATRLLTDHGFTPARYFYHMEIDMVDPPPAPVWPNGFVARAFRTGQDERIAHAAFEDAFQDHWGYSPIPYEEWVHRTYERDDFDAGLWHFAWDGDELAGFCTTTMRDSLAWVRGLGVRPPWRRHGLGMALLLQACGEFYRRGERRVGLGVDAANPTGATRLYERAGMHVAREYTVYARPVSP